MYSILLRETAIFQLCIIALGESYTSVQNVTIRSPDHCNFTDVDPIGEWVFNMTLSDWVNCNGNGANWTVTSDKRSFLSVQTVNERRNITARLQSPLLNATRQHQYTIELDILQHTNDSSILSVYHQTMYQLFFIWTARRVGEVCILIPFNCSACEHNQFRIILEENYTYNPSSESQYQIMIGYIKYYKNRRLLNSTSFSNATTSISPSAADSHLSQHCMFHDTPFYTTTDDGRQSSTTVFNHKSTTLMADNNCFSTSCGALSIALGVGLPLLIVVIIAIILNCYRNESTKTTVYSNLKRRTQGMSRD